MPLSFWIRRFLVVYSGTFLVLLVVALQRDRTWARAATESALWAGIAASIFTATRVYRSRQGQHCELCGDTPGSGPDGTCAVKKDEPGR
jgi:hypothetical protein